MNHTTVIFKDWLTLFTNSLNYFKVNRERIGSKVALNFISCIGSVAK